jgi:hypothetical protein
MEWYRKTGLSSAFFILASTAFAQTSSLKFIENKNQWPSTVDFAARTPGGRVMISPDHFSVYVFDQQKTNERHLRQHGEVSEADGHEEKDTDITGQHVRIAFLGADHSVRPKTGGRSEEYYNFFLGNDSSAWASRAYAYSEIVYPEIYAGVDVKISSVSENLKYDFMVHPEADPSVIRINFSGANQVYLDNGNLIIETAIGYLIEKKPYSYQLIDGVTCEVITDYQLDETVISFRFPDGYDPCYELIIDPLLIFSTFSGSTADNWGSTATPGEHGTLYSSGITNHINVGGTFPATPGVFQTTYGGNYDIAILKYDSIGANLLYASYLGGSSNDSPHSLIMDEKTQDLIIMGTTSSSNFPVTSGALSTVYNGGVQLSTGIFEFPFGSDIIIGRISSDGTTLKASTFLGGSNNDGINPTNSPLVRNYGDELRGDVITDSLGNVYISSVTLSSNFPAINSFNTTFGGGLTDAILVKVTPDLSAIIWSAFLGGSGVDAAHSLKLGSDYSLYVAGGTTSANFPTTAGTYTTTYSGNTDGWMMRIENDGSTLLASTFTGTTGFDQVYFVDLGTEGDVYVYGQTNGTMPVSPGVYHNANSGQFVQRLSGDLKTLVFSTVFGSGIGIPNISPTAFLVSECNQLYMAGWGGSTNSGRGFWNSSTKNMPLTPDALQKTTTGNDFYFMVLTGDAKELLYATYLGGNTSAIHVDGGTSRFDPSGIVYHAVCAGCGGGFDDFPTTPGAWSRLNKSGNCNNAAFKFDLSSLRARLQTNSVDFKSPNISTVCIPDSIRFQNFSTGGRLFEWDLGDGRKLTKSDTTSFLHQYSNEGVYRVKLTAIDLNTCTSIDSVFTTIRVFKSAIQVQNDDALCAGDTYQLQASGGVSYQWRNDTGPIASTLVKPEITTSYYVTITDANGCVKKDTVLLEVVPAVEVKLEYEYVSDCTSRPQLRVRNESDIKPDETYRFNFGDGTTDDRDEVLHTYQQDGTYTITLSGIREFCVYSATEVLPIYTLFVPNIITPTSSPGLNDVFTVQYGAKGNTPADAGVVVRLRVYNRWGNAVFESDNYQYDWVGEGLPAGIYYYVVTLDNQTTCRSWVQVVK